MWPQATKDEKTSLVCDVCDDKFKTVELRLVHVNQWHMPEPVQRAQQLVATPNGKAPAPAAQEPAAASATKVCASPSLLGRAGTSTTEDDDDAVKTCDSEDDSDDDGGGVTVANGADAGPTATDDDGADNDEKKSGSGDEETESADDAKILPSDKSPESKPKKSKAAQGSGMVGRRGRRR